jgi:hypothetical protein
VLPNNNLCHKKVQELMQPVMQGKLVSGKNGEILQKFVTVQDCVEHCRKHTRDMHQSQVQMTLLHDASAIFLL